MNRYILLIGFISTLLISSYAHSSGNDPRSKMIGKPSESPEASLLLPAVQAAKEARTKSSQPQIKTQRSFNRKPTLSTGRNQQQTADATCNGVNSCNDMIATCIALGGNVTQTGYDGATGSPNSATCYASGKN